MCKPVLPVVLTNDDSDSESRMSLSQSATSRVLAKAFLFSSGSSPGFSFPE